MHLLPMNDHILDHFCCLTSTSSIVVEYATVKSILWSIIFLAWSMAVNVITSLFLYDVSFFRSVPWLTETLKVKPMVQFYQQEKSMILSFLHDTEENWCWPSEILKCTYRAYSSLEISTLAKAELVRILIK